MNSIKYRGTSRVLGTAASLLLFLVFAICMIVIIGAGAGIYSRINTGYEMTYGSSAAIKYVSNKIRASDSCRILDDGNGIVLENGSILTVIYKGGGGIYEKSVFADSIITAEGGELVVETEDFSVSGREGLYEITVTCGSDTTSAFVRKGDISGKE